MVQLYCPFLPPIEEWIEAPKKYFDVTLVMRSVNAAEPEGQRKKGPRVRVPQVQVQVVVRVPVQVQLQMHLTLHLRLRLHLHLH